MLDIIRQIHASPAKAVIALTGGGADSLSWLLRNGGGSATLLKAVVPYSMDALLDYLNGRKPEQFCSAETASAMAGESLAQGLILSGLNPPPVVGIGLTCALRKDNERMGRVHHIYGAMHKLPDTMLNVSITLAHDDDYNRLDEEEIAACVVIYLLAVGCDVPVEWKQLRYKLPDLVVSPCLSPSSK